MWDVGCCVCVKCRGEGEFCFVFVSNKRRCLLPAEGSGFSVRENASH